MIARDRGDTIITLDLIFFLFYDDRRRRRQLNIAQTITRNWGKKYMYKIPLVLLCYCYGVFSKTFIQTSPRCTAVACMRRFIPFIKLPISIRLTYFGHTTSDTSPDGIPVGEMRSRRDYRIRHNPLPRDPFI